MPVYDYRCEKCGKEFEIEQKISESPIKKCSKCGGKVKRLISNTSFVLKGSGWYVTDYARKGKKEETPKAELKTTEKSKQRHSG